MLKNNSQWIYNRVINPFVPLITWYLSHLCCSRKNPLVLLQDSPFHIWTTITKNYQEFRLNWKMKWNSLSSDWAWLSVLTSFARQSIRHSQDSGIVLLGKLRNIPELSFCLVSKHQSYQPKHINTKVTIKVFFNLREQWKFGLDLSHMKSYVFNFEFVTSLIGLRQTHFHVSLSNSHCDIKKCLCM